MCSRKARTASPSSILLGCASLSGGFATRTPLAGGPEPGPSPRNLTWQGLERSRKARTAPPSPILLGYASGRGGFATRTPLAGGPEPGPSPRNLTWQARRAIPENANRFALVDFARLRLGPRGLRHPHPPHRWAGAGPQPTEPHASPIRQSRTPTRAATRLASAKSDPGKREPLRLRRFCSATPRAAGAPPPAPPSPVGRSRTPARGPHVSPLFRVTFTRQPSLAVRPVTSIRRPPPWPVV